MVSVNQNLCNVHGFFPRCITQKRVHTNGVRGARRSPSRTPPSWSTRTWRAPPTTPYSTSPSYLKFLTSSRPSFGSDSTKTTARATPGQPRLPDRPPPPALPRSSPLPTSSGGCGTELFSRRCCRCHTLPCFPSCRSSQLFRFFSKLKRRFLKNGQDRFFKSSNLPPVPKKLYLNLFEKKIRLVSIFDHIHRLRKCSPKLYLHWRSLKHFLW
jgi:hypothetical protein